MSIGVLHFHDIESVEATCGSTRAQKSGWLDINLHEKQASWQTSLPPAIRICIHFDESLLPKFQRLAALINTTFGENTTQETSSEV